MQFGNKYIVVALTDIREKGVATLEQVKDEVKQKAIKEKKAELFANDLTTAMAGSIQIDALATKLNLKVEQASNINFNTNAIPGLGNQPAVIGAVTALKAKTISKPIVGKDGVFIVSVESRNDAAAQKDYKAQQTAAIAQLQPRVDYEVYDALKLNANIVDHLVKFY